MTSSRAGCTISCTGPMSHKRTKGKAIGTGRMGELLAWCYICPDTGYAVMHTKCHNGLGMR